MSRNASNHNSSNTDSTASSLKMTATSPTMMDDNNDTSLSTASPSFKYWGESFKGLSGFEFLPDFTEHPKPKRKHSTRQPPEELPQPQEENNDENDENEVTFWHDFVAGGAAGCSSVVVGHPFDTIKVRMQTSSSSNSGLVKDFGGFASLFRGMGAPLSAAAIVNAIVFSSYGIGSRFYDEYIVDPATYQHLDLPHDPWQKATTCGSFAGLVQCIVICPMEHIKCRLQVQCSKTGTALYKGPMEATRQIVAQHGIKRLFQGWWSTCLREVPAFGVYFASYDYLKDRANTFFAQQAGLDTTSRWNSMQHTHTWVASMMAGGCAGCLTWACVYPVDVIKTRVQTASLTTPFRDLTMWKVGKQIVEQHGVKYLFRGLGVTLIRAFPVNGTIFPVYEFTLLQVTKWEYGSN